MSIDIGYRTGMIKVIEKTSYRKGGYVLWKCLCDCGNTIYLDTRTLERGKRRDCGCSSLPSGIKDLRGRRFGKLVCIELNEKRDDKGRVLWRCKCDCGNEINVPSEMLTKGYRKSCGCLSHPPLRKDIIGCRYDHLTVKEYAGKQNGLHHWKCLCDCGNEVVIGQTNLLSGKTKSCGCLNMIKNKDMDKCKEARGLYDGTSLSTLLCRMNNGPIASNTSGHNGIYLNKKNQKWTAQITFKKKTYYLGSFEDIADAISARKEAEQKYYQSFIEERTCLSYPKIEKLYIEAAEE